MAKVNQYKRLVEALDNVSTGFPSFFGIERLGLKKIFSEEDAQVFADMIPREYQTPAQFAAKNGCDEKWASEKLYDMSKRALIFRRRTEGGEGCYEYCQFPFAFGLIEFQGAGNPDKSYLPFMGAYAGLSKYGDGLGATMPMYRSVPFRKEMVVDNKVLPYDDIEEVLGRHERFAVSVCVCRDMHDDKKCNHPKETCIITDDMADFYVENEMGRSISRDEAREILVSGEKDGRVIQITNSKNAENICSCCSCGCAMLKIAGRFTKPAGKQWSNYHVTVVDEDACAGCGKCAAACGFNVLTVENGKVAVPADLFGCMGCGRCVFECKTGAIKLMQKPEEDLYEPPEDLIAAHNAWHDMKVKRVSRV